jgi:hypothetical protein
VRRRFGGAESGQVLPIFVVMSVILLGAAALVSDVAWWWTNEQRAKRAADAGALAGAIYLPGDQATAFSAALAETAKNGFTNGQDGVRITPRRDPGDPRKLLVDVDSNVGTFFARVFCWNEDVCLANLPVSVTGSATYVLPVPMGSPQNYYGVGHFVGANTVFVPDREDDETGWNPETMVVSGGRWSNPGNAASDNGQFTTETTNGEAQVWGSFNLIGEIEDDPSTVIDGLQVRLNDVGIQNSSDDDCEVDVEVSWDGGTTWSAPIDIDDLSTGTSSDKVVGSSSSTSPWGGRTWTRADFANDRFQVKLTWRERTGCNSNRSVRLDALEAQVSFHYDDLRAVTTIEEMPVRSPEGDVLTPQNFWGALQSQGAPNIQGDAYMTYYDTRTSRTNGDYLPQSYYQYAVEFPPGSSGGEVWVFDPGFCEVETGNGTGESWTIGGANGHGSAQPVSTYYRLWDTNGTPFNLDDDTLVGTSGDDFRRLFRSDHVLDDDPESNTDCSDDSWHNDWWRIGSGLDGGETYRLHTYSTDIANPSDQRNTTALNAFAVWAKARDGTPQVHGLGAMEAYVRLPRGLRSEFYLAQIDAEHAGKTMIIRLWDPGDTTPLSANLQILRPTTSTYEVIPFSYTAEQGSGAAADCGSRTGMDVTSVTTNEGGNGVGGRYNGCWLTIEIVLDRDYDAPHPSSDTVTSEGGWWKIRYNMGNQGNDESTDMTTWQVELRGSPVHLVLE